MFSQVLDNVKEIDDDVVEFCEDWHKDLEKNEDAEEYDDKDRQRSS